MGASATGVTLTLTVPETVLVTVSVPLVSCTVAWIFNCIVPEKSFTGVMVRPVNCAGVKVYVQVPSAF